MADIASSLVGGVFNSLGAATQAAVQGAVNTGVSQSIGAYNATVRQGLGTALSTGANGLLDSIGVKTSKIPIVGGILQNIAQAGVTNATTVFQHVIDGNLTLQNLPFFGNYNTNSILSNDPGTTGSIAGGMNGLVNTLGSFLGGGFGSVDRSTNSIWGTLGLGAGLGISEGSTDPTGGSSIMSNTSYAADLANSFPPKYKFLYMAEIYMKGEYNDIKTNFMFLVKQFDRPKVTIEHDEVNFYSYRSMVPKRVVYQPVTLVLHDDAKSSSMNFFVSYMRKISPIFNQHDSHKNETNSMNYADATSSYGLRTTKDNINVIEKIVLTHYFNTNRNMDKYTFFNPKILEFTPDELNMESSDSSSISLSIAYDQLTIEPGTTAITAETQTGMVDIKPSFKTEYLKTPASTSGSTKLNVTSNNKVVFGENEKESVGFGVTGRLFAAIPSKITDLVNTAISPTSDTLGALDFALRDITKDKGGEGMLMLGADSILNNANALIKQNTPLAPLSLSAFSDSANQNPLPDHPSVQLPELTNSIKGYSTSPTVSPNNVTPATSQNQNLRDFKAAFGGINGVVFATPAAATSAAQLFSSS